MKIIISIYLSILVTTHCFSQDSIFYQNVEWSPDGKKICLQAITRLGKGISSASYIVNLSDLNIERKIENSFFPSWSPDGRLIGYSRRRTPGRGLDIWYTNVITGDSVKLTNDTANNNGLSFSPDGEKICFSSDRDGGRNLYIMNKDGSGLQRITSDTNRYFNPVWSPKGNKIVCYKERGDSKDKVYVIVLPDKKEIKVTDDTLHNTFPGWLPGGETISYTSSDHSKKPASRITFIDADGKRKRIISNTEGCFFSRVSPDGKKLALIKGGWPMSNVYIANIDDANLHCITCKLKIQ
jgi:Tol biopolymer transport system component